MMRLRLPMALLALLAVSAQAAPGYPASKKQLVDVLDHSAVAVVGRIESVGEGAPVERRQFGPYGGFSSPIRLLLRPAIVRVEVVLKGDEIAPGASVPFSFLSPETGKPGRIGLPEYKPGECWLLFLGRAEGHLEPVNPLGFQDLPLPDGYRPQEPNYRLSLQRTEAVLADLLRLGSKQPPVPQPNRGRSLTDEILQTLFSGSLSVVTPRRSHTESEALSVYRSAFATEDLLAALFLVATSEADPATRASAAAILVRAGSSDAVEPLVSAERERTHQGSTIDYSGLNAIEQVRDPGYLDLLHELLSDPDARFHAPAASALREIADSSSIPHLIKALDDPSFDVRYLAVTSLAAITGDNARYLAVDLFRAQEADQIAYWKAWYQTRQKDRPPQAKAP